MISLGDHWVLSESRIYHACGPALLHAWTGEPVCDCGAVVPRRVQSFHHWVQQDRARAHPSPPQRSWVRGRPRTAHW